MLKFNRGDLVQFAQEKGKYIQGIILKTTHPTVVLDDRHVEVLFYNEGKQVSVILNKKSIELIQKYRSSN